MDEPKLVYPYCGGCGHNYFNLPQIPEEEAKERAKTTKCHYCIDDEKHEKKKDYLSQFEDDFPYYGEE